MPSIKKDDVLVHVLNVGFGDAIVIELPCDDSGLRPIGIVDCNSSTKVRRYLKDLAGLRPWSHVAFLCATHPHLDHIRGMGTLLGDATLGVREFWDSGFRHKTATYQKILLKLHEKKVPLRRVSSGMEWYFGTCKITALAPAVSLRNRYGTYGVDMNNASIVLRIENCVKDAVIIESERYRGKEDPEAIRRAGGSVVILGGDAEFDSWAKITEEYPRLDRTSEHDPLVKAMVNLLSCYAVKVSHHGSMHSAPFEVYERMSPAVAILSNKQATSTATIRGQRVTRALYPHPVTAEALRESGARILSTDGSFETEDTPRAGSVVIAISPGGRGRTLKLGDTSGKFPAPPASV